MPILCTSNVRNYLASYGYGTLPLPKSDIGPLGLLGKNGGRLAPLGPLAATFRPGPATLPEIKRRKTAGLSGAKSTSLEASLALDVLGEVIGALSGSSLGLKAVYKDAKDVQFEFGDVMENYVDVNALDAYLAATPLDPSVGPYLKSVLDTDEVYVITAAVDSGQISVKASRKTGGDLELDVPVIQRAVGGKISVGSASASNSVLTYTSTELPLVIGIQVVRLYFDGAKYRTLKLVKAEDTQPASVAGGAAAADDRSHEFPAGELVL